ncbi:MAG: VWA domain-containing protein, partial [Acidobacteriota bacterium]
AVAGLTADDFQLFEDGKPQKITGFYTIQNGTVKLPGGAADRDRQDQFRRKVVLMVDNNSVDKIQRDRALTRLDDFIDNQFGQDYEWSVISVGSSVETLQPFTEQKGEIREALVRARNEPSISFQRDVDRRILSDPGRDALRGEEFDRIAGEETGYSFGALARFQGNEQTYRNLVATVRAAKAVIQTCRAYSSSAGKKLLLLVSGGMEMNTTFAQFDDPKDRQASDMRRELEQVLDTMVKEANAANFTIYVVNANGHQQQAPQHDITNSTSGTGADNVFQAGAAAAPIDTSDRDSAAIMLTAGTGGRYLPSNVIDQSLQTIDDETGNFYSLAYSPAHPSDGAYHRISVKVTRPGLQVRSREGYLDLSADQKLEQSLKSPITFAKEKGSLPVSIRVGLPEQGAGKMIVPITASMPLRSVTFLPRDSEELGRVHIYLTIYDSSGKNIGYTHNVQDLKVPVNLLASNLNKPFNYTMKVNMKKGSYTFVVTLRDDLSNEIGSAFQDVRL